MSNENAARAERAEYLARKLEQIPVAAYRPFHSTNEDMDRVRLEAPRMLRNYAAALRCADADRPARTAKAPALTALLDWLDKLSTVRGEIVPTLSDLAACRAELAALTTERPTVVPSEHAFVRELELLRLDEHGIIRLTKHEIDGILYAFRRAAALTAEPKLKSRISTLMNAPGRRCNTPGCTGFGCGCPAAKPLEPCERCRDTGLALDHANRAVTPCPHCGRGRPEIDRGRGPAGNRGGWGEDVEDPPPDVSRSSDVAAGGERDLDEALADILARIDGYERRHAANVPFHESWRALVDSVAADADRQAAAHWEYPCGCREWLDRPRPDDEVQYRPFVNGERCGAHIWPAQFAGGEWYKRDIPTAADRRPPSPSREP